MTYSSYEQDAVKHWNQLHAQRRFRPQYPSEHVVRFLMAHFPEQRRASARAIDIGIGGGRHVKLLCDLRFQAYGIDISAEGLQYCEQWLRSAGQSATLTEASMRSLPFPDNFFDAAIVSGVYYYADTAGMQQAIAEMRRVLSPEGWAFLILRTTADYRCGKGARLEENTYRLEIEDTNELGTVQHFLGEADVPRMFSAFAEVGFEKDEITFNQRQAMNSDWLITVQK